MIKYCDIKQLNPDLLEDGGEEEEEKQRKSAALSKPPPRAGVSSAP